MAVPHRFRTTLTSGMTLAIALSMVTGVVAAAPGGRLVWKDKARDVTLPNADMVSGSASVFGDQVDLRVAFAARPFPDSATHTITWCIDADENPQVGDVCGSGTLAGADGGISLFWVPGVGLSADVFAGGTGTSVDVHPYLWFDPGNITLRLLLPASLLGGLASFHYVVVSAFGGSGGMNDMAPRRPDFAKAQGYFVSGRGEVPFAGDHWYP